MPLSTLEQPSEVGETSKDQNAESSPAAASPQTINFKFKIKLEVRHIHEAKNDAATLRENPVLSRRQRIALKAETNARVAAFLAEHSDPSLTEIEQATGISRSTICSTAAWKARGRVQRDPVMRRAVQIDAHMIDAIGHNGDLRRRLIDGGLSEADIDRIETLKQRGLIPQFVELLVDQLNELLSGERNHAKL
jgi:hypothetical protein